MLAEVEAKTVGKTMGDVEAEALVDTLSEMPSKVVVKTTADTLTCVKANAPVNRGNIAVAGVKTYTVVKTVKKLKDQVLVYTQAYVFAQATAKSVTDTLACFYGRALDISKHTGRCDKRVTN